MAEDDRAPASAGTEPAARVAADDMAAAVAEATEALRRTNQALKEEKQAIRAKLDAYGDVPPALVRTLFSELTEADRAILSERGLDGLIADRTKMLTERLNALLIETEVRAALLADPDFHAAAIEDALPRARAAFRIDAEGAVVPVAEDGPADIAAWVETMRAAAPHWWRQPAGAGLSAAGTGESVERYTLKDWRLALSAAAPAERQRLLQARTAGRIAVA